ncbi:MULTISPECIES: hypothetical protein [unclassified Corynebacterium]|uniref:hypothetical protein n=1 Tax=unclassified Corynebacterium TaxID=2624378 RepID=UPI003523829F
MSTLYRRLTITIASAALLFGAAPAVASADALSSGSSANQSTESSLEWFIGQILQGIIGTTGGSSAWPFHAHTVETEEAATGMHSEHQTDFFYTVIDKDTIRMTILSGDSHCYGVRGVVTTTPDTVGIAAVKGIREGVADGPCTAVASYPRIDVTVPGGINGRAIRKITLNADQLN